MPGLGASRHHVSITWPLGPWVTTNHRRRSWGTRGTVDSIADQSPVKALADHGAILTPTLTRKRAGDESWLREYPHGTLLTNETGFQPATLRDMLHSRELQAATCCHYDRIRNQSPLLCTVPMKVHVLLALCETLKHLARFTQKTCETHMKKNGCVQSPNVEHRKHQETQRVTEEPRGSRTLRLPIRPQTPAPSTPAMYNTWGRCLAPESFSGGYPIHRSRPFHVDSSCCPFAND